MNDQNQKWNKFGAKLAQLVMMGVGLALINSHFKLPIEVVFGISLILAILLPKEL